MEKKISYTARDYSTIKDELINLSNKYYPNMATNYEDKSVSSWLIDLIASVGDDLSYNIDKAYQETLINTANLKSSVLNIARENGLKVPGAKASLCEVEITCELPKKNTLDNISSPDWDYAPVIKRASQVAAGIYTFEIQNDVNFAEQFNSDGYSDRTYKPKRNTSGIVTGYIVTKKAIVTAGTSKVYSKTISSSDLSPFMEIVLPEQDVMNVEGIIFKTNPSYNKSPNLSEYYVSDEEYKWADEGDTTYKFFEVNSLADQYVFGPKMSNENIIQPSEPSSPFYNCTEIYDDYNLSGDVYSRIYKGEWKAVKQKYITEYTDKGYTKIIFGSGNNYETVPKTASTYAKWQMSKIINNDMLGILPEAGWTMYCLYRVGGGNSSNVAPNTINSWVRANCEWQCGNLDNTTKTKVIKTLTVNNPSVSIAGKDAPSVNEIKYLTKYNTSSQERCVTLKDYKSRLMLMPPRYGCPFRVSVAEENNKILMHLLTIANDSTLSSKIPSTLTDNIKEYLSLYKNLTDFIEIRSGFVVNLGLIVNVYVDKTYSTSNVVSNIITKVSDYMDINSHDMGDDIFIGDLEKEITLLDGVISLIDVEVYNIYDSNGYGVKANLPQYIVNNENICGVGEVSTFPNVNNSYRIDMDKLENVLTSDSNTMFEIKYPSNDIKVRVKLK